MTIRIAIGDEPYRLGVGVYVLRGEGQHLELKRDDGSWYTPDEAVQSPPTFELHDDEARALLDALVRHYHGAEDTRTLRKDYDAERARVDKFIDATVNNIKSPRGIS